jgi:hypothetical protein
MIFKKVQHFLLIICTANECKKLQRWFSKKTPIFVLPKICENRRKMHWDHIIDPCTEFQGFVYSLHDHAEVALELWRQIGIRRAHLVHIE